MLKPRVPVTEPAPEAGFALPAVCACVRVFVRVRSRSPARRRRWTVSNVCLLQNAILYNSGFDTGLGFVIYKTPPDCEAIYARKGPALHRPPRVGMHDFF